MIADALVVLDDPIQNVSHYPFSHTNPDGIQTVPKLWRVSPWFLSTLTQLLIRHSTNLLATNLHRLTLFRFRLDEMIACGPWSWFIGAKLLSQPMLTSSNGNIFRSPVNIPHKGQWRGALMFYLICVWINGCVNNRVAGDLRRYRAHYEVIVMNGFILYPGLYHTVYFTLGISLCFQHGIIKVS